MGVGRACNKTTPTTLVKLTFFSSSPTTPRPHAASSLAAATPSPVPRRHATAPLLRRPPHRPPMERHLQQKLETAIFTLQFSVIVRLVCSRVESTRELITQNWNCAQVSIIPEHSFKGKA
jgi:hypothetical protein